MKKIALLILAVLFAFPVMAAAKMKISGQKKPEEVTEKDGVYTVAPQGKMRIQLYPAKGGVAVLPDMEVEISAEVSGSGNISLGCHIYNSKNQWKASAGSKLIRVDAEESETVKATIKINRADAASVRPWISVISGKVNIEELKLRIPGGLDAANLKTAPVIPGWQYANMSRALKCAEDKGVLEIVTGRRQVVELMSSLQSAKDGDVFKFTGNVTGKGRLIIGLHLYNKSNAWQGTTWVQVPIANGKVDKLPAITVKTPAKKSAVAYIRGAIRVTPGSSVKLENIKLGK